MNRQMENRIRHECVDKTFYGWLIRSNTRRRQHCLDGRFYDASVVGETRAVWRRSTRTLGCIRELRFSTACCFVLEGRFLCSLCLSRRLTSFILANKKTNRDLSENHYVNIRKITDNN
ncbi:hypothetical protein V1478_016625 [Vespula squamosa]|uniref:Uncharacterized protein n=1 Tax=Vespula squamosa TaxID=30214 RepID=A0ABD2A0E1_VESSQ